MSIVKLKKELNNLYNSYNKQQYIHPDPLEFSFLYDDIKNREIVGLIASCLAYGRVAQILKSISYVLDIMKPNPYDFLMSSADELIYNCFKNFSYRFAKNKHISDLLVGIKNIILEFGSLNKCFVAGMKSEDINIIPAMTEFTKHFYQGQLNPGHLMVKPEKKSACKRLNLYLRWMVRSDEVDPGGWKGISKKKLIIPLDTHMHKMSLKLNFTKRKQANITTAIEITENFKKICPNDPTKYDFTLTRFGIRSDLKEPFILRDLKIK